MSRYPSIDLRESVVFITGAARGIGLATSEQFSATGATVVMADLDSDALVGVHVPRAIALDLDVTDDRAVDDAVDHVEREVGPIGVLVNNAGIMPLSRFVDEPREVSRKTIEINLHGPMNGMRAVLPRMYARGVGHVVNVASMAGKLPAPGMAPYNASKFAVVGLTASVRREARRFGVSVSAILPTAVRTELISGIPPIPGLPIVEPEDVAAAIVKSCGHRRGEIPVPRYLAAYDLVAAVLPESAMNVARRLLREDAKLDEIDQEARIAYRTRITAGRGDHQ